jgi:hypothetical protein
MSVAISDSEPLSCIASVVVEVLDVNEAPWNLQSDYNFTLFELVRTGRSYENFA